MTTQKRHLNVDYSTSVDRLRTVSLRNKSHPTCVVKAVNGILTFPLLQKLCNKKDINLKFAYNPPKDRGPTANQCGETIKIITQTSKVIKIVYQKYINTSARVGYAPPTWKRAQVKGMRESRLTIRGDEDQGLVFFEEVGTSPVK